MNPLIQSLIELFLQNPRWLENFHHQWQKTSLLKTASKVSKKADSDDKRTKFTFYRTEGNAYRFQKVNESTNSIIDRTLLAEPEIDGKLPSPRAEDIQNISPSIIFRDRDKKISLVKQSSSTFSNENENTGLSQVEIDTKEFASVGKEMSDEILQKMINISNVMKILRQ
ncbi:hypothetical protein AVEN_20341-1 [Araneus ventricosus]|uniref:Uncharacterized protein n=1 Tax=Araneus ventricosus TaxID=182803 RepID=A0A4Y2IQT6_ARAVE|nr:hypothetical protein AVEN_20341-1 [Araneus ventricosus]